MTSVVEIDIAAPRARVADLFADPANNPKWMDDIDRCEPLTNVSAVVNGPSAAICDGCIHA